MAAVNTLYLSSVLFVTYLLASAEKIKFPDKLDFPETVLNDGTSKNMTVDQTSSEEKMAIPIDMIMKLNKITDPDELFKEFVIEDKKVTTAGIGASLYGFASKLRASPLLAGFLGSGRTQYSIASIAVRSGGIGTSAEEKASSAGSEAVERASGAVVPRPAGCIPELTTIPLWHSEDRRIFSFPSCTRVERCGGCCQHELLSCQPVKTEIINYQVIITQYLGENNLGYTGKEIVPVERHTKCKCDCIMKESDCTALQVYKENECRCVCTNLDEKEKCKLDSENKLWDPHTCLCECRNTIECSAGHFFSSLTCQCELIRETQVRVASNDRHDYNFYKVLPNYGSHQRQRTSVLK